ncbi:MAG: hypothetical protein DHS20C15_15150 [Planctomycetota bacterium]|nr:MAG: hypothetical protein DHS20C15_15150 [Planctomycetota bacterium]
MQLADLPISREDLATTLTRMGEWLAGPTPRRVATANLDFLEIARRHDALRACLQGADLVTADGAPLLWLSRLAGEPIPERVAGADFVPLLVGEAAARSRSVYFLGGEDGVAERTIEVLRERYPDLKVAGWSSPFLDLNDVDGCRAAAEAVAATSPDLVLVAFGCPKQDLFIERHLHELGCHVAVGVGGTFNFIIGRIKRSPMLLQKCGLEWLWRFAVEPRRLFLRYWRDGSYFLKLYASALWRKALRRAV